MQIKQFITITITTMEQRDSVTLRPTRVKRLPSKFQDHVLRFIQLHSEQNFETLRTGTVN